MKKKKTNWSADVKMAGKRAGKSRCRIRRIRQVTSPGCYLLALTTHTDFLWNTQYPGDRVLQVSFCFVSAVFLSLLCCRNSHVSVST